MLEKMLTSRGFLLTCNLNIKRSLVADLLTDMFDLIYEVEDPIHTVSLWKRKQEPGELKNGMRTKVNYNYQN